MRSRHVVAVAATLLLLLAGCTEQTSGDPSAGGTTAGETVSPGQETPTTTEPEEDGGSVADMKPCEILDSGDLQALELTGGEEEGDEDARVCRYRHEGATLDDTMTVSVELFGELGLDDLNTDNIKRSTIGSHEAASWTDPLGVCGVSIGVTESSRIDNTAVGGDNEQLACQLATELATAVERRLP